MSPSAQNLMQVKAGSHLPDLAMDPRPGRGVSLRSASAREKAAWVPVASLNAILSALPPSTMEAFGPHLREVSLTLGDILIEKGEIPKAVYFPATAVLGSFKELSDGHVVQVAALGRFEASGLLACLSDTPAAARIGVQLSGSAAAVPSHVLRQMARDHPDLLVLLLKAVQREARQTEQNLACNAHHDTTRRMARWLLALADRSGQDDMWLTQEHMAVMAGVRRTTVNAAALNLRTAGVIRYKRGRIRILDRQGLEAAACPCHGVLEQA
jgi:CRP-like cAMP-binding protein